LRSSFSTSRGVIVSSVDGPVRAIRSVMGTNSGIYNQQSIFFTKCRAYYRNDFRVHDATTADVSQAYDMFDWSDVMNGASYSNSYNLTPVTVNGNQDNLNNNKLPEWALYEGDQGSIVINASIVKNSNHYTFGETLQDVVQREGNAGTAWDAYYDDSGSGTTYKCTGDNRAYGSAGWVVYTNQCYDYRYNTQKCNLLNFPNEIVFNRTNYYLPPGEDNTSAERYGEYAQQPLQATVLDVNVLPVELISFQAKEEQDGIFLSWETATEMDNAYFELQRSTDGKSFKSIVQIKGHGTSLEAHEYGFLDVLPEDGNNYYRLKQMDFSGDYEYSKVISIQWKNKKASDLKVFPNPSTNELYYLLLNGSKAARINIYDTYGKLLRTKTDADGFIDINNLDTGMYILEVHTSRNKLYKRFYKL
ncbi:MAG: T9SS type A sorting domain-containing protein, partial [Bacteroidota bacterium]